MGERSGVLAAAPDPTSVPIEIAPGLHLRTLPIGASVRLHLARRHVADAASIRIRDVALPTEPNRCRLGDPTVLWLAPDGWLLLSDSSDATRLQDEARAACGDLTAAAVDVSDAIVRLELTGPLAASLLARGSGVDFSPTAFGPGHATRTRLAQLAAIVYAPRALTWRIVVDRAPAQWLHDWLCEAASGLEATE